MKIKTICFGLGVVVSALSYKVDAAEKMITHKEGNVSFNIQQLKKELEKKENRALPLQEEIRILEDLSQFELGRFLLANKGLDGYWIAYVILYGSKKQNLHPLEDWFLHRAPSAKATRERFYIFRKELQKRLKDKMKIASVPCGLMDDLLTLDYHGKQQIQLIGIDLDEKSLVLAAKNAETHQISTVEFIQKNAWNLDINEEFDIITSNGLNIYEPDDAKVCDLYKEFCKSLKPQGILITSFFTPPPSISKESTWQNVNPQDALKQKALFTDVIEATWQAFRTEAQMRHILEKAGFTVLEVIYDSQGIMPTIIARK